MFAICHPHLSTEQGMITGLFLAGLVGGVTHCAGMCGPFVIAQAGMFEKLSAFSLLPYHVGRIATYVILSALTNTVFNAAFAGSGLKLIFSAPILAFAGVLFLLAAFPRLSVLFPWATSLPMRMPTQLFKKAFAFFSAKKSILRHLFLGMLLGLMPCGLVLSALLASSVAPSAGYAALSMAAFGAGTIPALTVTAFGGRLLINRFPKFSSLAFRSVMAANGAGLILLALYILI